MTSEVKSDQEIKALRRQIDRSNQHLDCALKWLELLERDSNLISYFQARECYKIGIYGAAEFGRLLHRELSRSGIVETVYFMDKKAQNCRRVEGIPVFLPEELPNAPKADMIVVTAFVAFSSISETLLKMKPELPVVSLKNILDVRMDEEWTWK